MYINSIELIDYREVDDIHTVFTFEVEVWRGIIDDGIDGEVITVSIYSKITTSFKELERIAIEWVETKEKLKEAEDDLPF